MIDNLIEVIGIGLDGATGLPENVRQLVENATVLVGSQRHLNYFPHQAAQKIILGDFLDAIIEIQQRLQENERIVILVSGDPLFFGLGRLLLEKFPADNLRFYPHISSVQLAFNRIKIPWQDAKIVSVHGRALEELGHFLHQGLDKIAILTDNENTPNAIARFYLSLSLPTLYDFWICENLESSQEKITRFTTEEIETLATLPDNYFASLNVVILLRQETTNNLNLKSLPLLGLPDKVFLSFNDQPGLMTKREIRIMILGELALQPGQIIWDIGAGTGSVSIEMARLCPTSQIYAIEKTAIGINLIEKNCQRFRVTNITPIHGTAPDILENLPQPHRIFIGGSSGKLIDILEKCANKLFSDGKIVLALATLEHLNSCLTWLNDNNWHYHLLQLQVSRSVPVGKFTRFLPLNPVTLVTAFQPSIQTLK